MLDPYQTSYNVGSARRIMFVPMATHPSLQVFTAMPDRRSPS